jgi:hypothetical protein
MMCEKLALESVKNKFDKSQKSNPEDKGIGLITWRFILDRSKGFLGNSSFSSI